MSKKIVTAKLIKFQKCLIQIWSYLSLCWESTILNKCKKVGQQQNKKLLTAMDIAPNDS